MKQIVIVGGGFAGVAATKELLRWNLPQTEITLIDKNPFHLFTPSLYEVATSEEPMQNIAIPFEEIFGKKVKVIVDTVEKIDAQKNVIKAKKNTAIPFDYLIIALGSESSYFGIEGLKEYSVPLKSLQDAVKIKNTIAGMCCKEGKCERTVQLIIGGGGFSGTELAAEMLMYKSRLARQNGLDMNCLKISIIQGSDRLLKELDAHVSDIAQKRIEGKSVNFCFGGHITKVTKSRVFTDDGKEYPYDILLWTGGVSASHIVKDSSLPVSSHGQLLVNEFLQVQGFSQIFAVGDVCGFLDVKSQKPAATVAQVAEEEGKVAGENVAREIVGKELQKYTYRHFGYIVPLKGHFAAAELGAIHIDGFFAWVLQQLVFFRYLVGILPFFKAMKKWNRFEKMLSQ